MANPLHASKGHPSTNKKLFDTAIMAVQLSPNLWIKSCTTGDQNFSNFARFLLPQPLAIIPLFILRYNPQSIYRTYCDTTGNHRTISIPTLNMHQWTNFSVKFNNILRGPPPTPSPPPEATDPPHSPSRPYFKTFDFVSDYNIFNTYVRVGRTERVSCTQATRDRGWHSRRPSEISHWNTTFARSKVYLHRFT